ncbi:MAG: 23S rRNA (adenine(2503)-C(2))-methyltransferase RlmN, partial [Clostridia bacterium]|nr:23S rRNA (adenine(2503)-C(2))-methyltransferase RlmN [Clostridia bacterium]
YYVPQIERKYVSAIDGTVKYLFRMFDGQMIESVVMSYEHGYTICVSCQCGCRMGCKFCASTIAGKVRDLSAGEILSQIIAAQRDLGIRISNIVMMGIGEPLDNYDNTIKFLKLVSDENNLNIGSRHISVSTCGVVDNIYELAKEKLGITLSISLHAYADEVRSAIMPVNKKWNIDALLTSCASYFRTTGRRISFEYTLIQGVNDSEQGALSLAAVLKKYMKDMPLHVNLIPVNDVKEREFKATEKNAAIKFMNTLNKNGVNATIRRKLGSDINASCGQLRREESKK